MRFPEVPTLSDGTVTLRAHHIGDAEGVYEQCQDPLSQEWTTVPIPYSRDDAKRFVREIMPGGWREDVEWGSPWRRPTTTGRPGSPGPSRCATSGRAAPRSPSGPTPGRGAAG